MSGLSLSVGGSNVSSFGAPDLGGSLPASPTNNQRHFIYVGYDNDADDQLWGFQYYDDWLVDSYKWIKVFGEPLVSQTNPNLGGINPPYTTFQIPDDLTVSHVAPLSGIGVINYWATIENVTAAPHVYQYGITDDGIDYPVPAQIEEVLLQPGEKRPVSGISKKSMVYGSQHMFVVSSPDDVPCNAGRLTTTLNMLRAE